MMTFVGQVMEDLAGSPDPSPRDRAHPTDSDLNTANVKYWTGYLRIGFAVLAAMSLVCVVFMRVSPQQPNRQVLTAVASVVTVLGAVMAFEAQRIAIRPWRSSFSWTMHLLSGAGLTAFCYFSGDVDSRLSGLLVLPVFSAALAFSPVAVMLSAGAAVGEGIFLAATDRDVTSSRDDVVAIFALVLGSAVLAVAFSLVRSRLQQTEGQERLALVRSARTDSLTGCGNHLTFEEWLSEQMDRYRRRREVFSLIIADVDLLKRLNDTFGHVAGDGALAAVGRTLTSECRPSDHVARVGGDEFAIILPSTNLAQAALVARRLDLKLKRSVSEVTLSMGVAEVRPGTTSAVEVYRDADRMLYLSKERGRGRVTWSKDQSNGAELPSVQQLPKDADWSDDRKVLEQRIYQSERDKTASSAQLEGLLSAAPVGIWFADGDFRLQMANNTASRLYFDMDSTLSLGKKLSDLLPERWARIEPHCRRLREDATSVTFEDQSPADAASGRPGVYWLVTLFPVLADSALNGIGCAMIDISSRKQLEEANENLIDTIAAAMAAAVEVRDPYTAGHQARVAEIATAIARELGLDADTQRDIHLAATVHDVGKIRTPADILSRPGPLTDAEMALVREHARSGFEILQSVEFPTDLCRMVLEHHERLDGSGYPNGLVRDEICQGARIIAVADVFDAITTSRPYRPNLGAKQAIDEISDGAGRTYDPEATAACLRLYAAGLLLADAN